MSDSKSQRTPSSEEASFVFWDGYGLDAPNTGVYVHARALASALKEQAVYPCVVGTAKAIAAFNDLPTRTVRAGILPEKVATNKLVWPLKVNRELRQIQQIPVVLHGLSNLNLPLTGVNSRRVRTVLTVHDLIPFLAPEGVSRAYRWQLAAVMPRLLRMADGIICVSDWTRTTLLERFNGLGLEAKTTVIPNGMPAYAPLEPSADGGVTRLLYVSRFEGYKRLELLFKILRCDSRFQATLVTNAMGLQFAQTEASDLLRRGALCLRSGLSEAQLIASYKEAHVYLQPSLFEGFCLPAAQALSLGRPVVYQTGSGIDEVAGGGDVAVGLGAKASALDWAEAVQFAAARASKSDYHEKLQRFLAGKPTWKDAASALKKLYNSLRA